MYALVRREGEGLVPARIGSVAFRRGVEPIHVAKRRIASSSGRELVMGLCESSPSISKRPARGARGRRNWGMKGWRSQDWKRREGEDPREFQVPPFRSPVKSRCNPRCGRFHALRSHRIRSPLAADPIISFWTPFNLFQFNVFASPLCNFIICTIDSLASSWYLQHRADPGLTDPVDLFPQPPPSVCCIILTNTFPIWDPSRRVGMTDPASYSLSKI